MTRIVCLENSRQIFIRDFSIDLNKNLIKKDHSIVPQIQKKENCK
jgi:hypothetical protein